MVTGGLARALVRAGTLGACAVAVHTAVNLSFLRTPDPDSPEVGDLVTVLIPARDEAAHVEATVRSALAQTGVPRLQVLVLDDGSHDGTAAIVDRLAAGDSRVRLVHGDDLPPPAGWLGKTWACARLADQATGDVLVFVDADVLLYPHAIRAAVGMLRGAGVTLVAPYPLQLSQGWLERLVQPLVTWLWVALLPLRWAESSTRPSLSAANGQLLVFDADAYRAIGGHGCVRSDVIEDVGLMRALRADGRATLTVDGSGLAQCRMYEGGGAVVDGYGKSLWSALGGPVGSLAVNALLVIAFVAPAAAAVTARDRRTRRWGAAGYAAGVMSRALVARRTGERLLPDVLLQPASIGALVALNAISWRRHAQRRNTWKGRPVTAQVAR